MDDAHSSVSGKSIAVIGLGFVGSSYAKALRKLKPKSVIVIDKGQAADEVLKETDILILALYPEEAVDFLKNNVCCLKNGVLITDACGVKQEIVKSVGEFLPGYADFVGGHPIAEEEDNGLKADGKDLFEGNLYILTPSGRNAKDNIRFLEDMASALGCSEVISISPEEHDRIVSLTSQLPYAAAVALLNLPPSRNSLSMFAGRSYADAIRAAAGDPALWEQLFMMNTENLLVAIAKFEECIGSLKSAIRSNDIEALDGILELASARRRKIASSLRAGFQGVEGSFSHQALTEYFGEEAEAVSFRSFRDVFEALDKGDISYGVLPLENSSTGGISEVYDLLGEYGFYIVGEKNIKVCHNLLGIRGADISEICEVYSHIQGFLQSKAFFEKHPEWKQVNYHNTAKSAQHVRNENSKTKACVASKKASEIYGLEILAENINDSDKNYTRFIVICRELEVSTQARKISIVATLPHKVGSLYSVLKHFADNDSSLMKIESRPILGKPWEYAFYIDFQGNMLDRKTKNIFKELAAEGVDYKFLGNY